MRTLIAATLFILALSSVRLGQTQYLAAYADLKASLKLTENKIKSERPETSRSALRCDRSVITSSIAAVEKSFLEKGFNKNDAEEVSLLAWKQVRFGSPLQPNRCMDQASFIAFVQEWGRLAIDSSPSGAEIRIDDRLLEDKTSKKVWLPVKDQNQPYKVLLTKPGYKPLELQCKIENGKESGCSATLVTP